MHGIDPLVRDNIKSLETEGTRIFADIMTNHGDVLQQWRSAACLRSKTVSGCSMSIPTARRRLAGSTDHIVRTIPTKLRGLTLRRAVAVMCALAFLLVGFCHTVEHANAAIPVIALQMQSGDSDNSPDAPGKTGIGVDHCHGCVIVGIAVAGPAVLPSRIKAAYPAATLVGLRSYSPIADTPPPIFTI